MILSGRSITTMSNVMPYVSRKINGVKDLEVFRVAHENKKNILLKGPTGAAKTMVATHYAIVNGYFVIKINCSTAADPSALFGRFVPNVDSEPELDGDGNPKGAPAFRWVDGLVADAVRKAVQAGLKVVLILDEINMLDPRLASTLFPLLDSNRELIILDNSETLKVTNDNLLIVATMNPGYRGTKSLNKALTNRFPFIIEWGYDDNVEKKLIPSDALREVVKDLRVEEKEGRIDAPFSTNMMVEFVDNYNLLGFEFAVNMAANKNELDTSVSVVKAKLQERKGAIVKQLDAAKEMADVPGMENIPSADDDVIKARGKNGYENKFGWLDIIHSGKDLI